MYWKIKTTHTHTASTFDWKSTKILLKISKKKYKRKPIYQNQSESESEGEEEKEQEESENETIIEKIEKKTPIRKRTIKSSTVFDYINKNSKRNKW